MICIVIPASSVALSCEEGSPTAVRATQGVQKERMTSGDGSDFPDHKFPNAGFVKILVKDANSNSIRQRGGTFQPRTDNVTAVMATP